MKATQNPVFLAGLAAAGAAYYFLVYKKPAAAKKAAGLAGGLAPANFAATSPKPGVPAAAAAPGLTSTLTGAGINLATQAASGLLGALFGGGAKSGGGGGGGGLSFGGGGAGASRPALQTPEAGTVTTGELFGGSGGNSQPVDNGIPFQTDPTVSSDNLNAVDSAGQDFTDPTTGDPTSIDFTGDPFDPNTYE